MSKEYNAYQNSTAMHFGAYLNQKGITHRDLEGMSPADIQSHATASGLGRVPNEDTLKLTHDFMKRLANPPSDPFAGL
jgi:hypothetical protein